MLVNAGNMSKSGSIRFFCTILETVAALYPSLMPENSLITRAYSVDAGAPCLKVLISASNLVTKSDTAFCSKRVWGLTPIVCILEA